MLWTDRRGLAIARHDRASFAGKATTYSWAEVRVKARNRKPVSDVIKHLVEQVPGINNTRESERVGW